MQTVIQAYSRALRALVLALGGMSAAGIGVMILVTCVDVVLRKFGHPIKGSYDLVRLASAVTLACGLPYTTAVKGHVSIEYFLHKLGRVGRLIAGTALGLLALALFGVLAWRCAVYGEYFHANNQVSDTLRVPLFWLPHLMGLSSAVTGLVILYHMVHPERELIKP